MALPTVELDDLPNGGPEAVDLEAPPSGFEPDIELRPRQLVAVEEGEEAVLELADGSPGRFGAAGERGAIARMPRWPG